jgi:hypothetical protein
VSEHQIKIKDIKPDYSGHTTDKVYEWNREVITGDLDWGHSLFWSDMGGGFEAILVQSMSRMLGDSYEDTHVEVVFHVSAFFDGARHIYFNPYDPDTECKGYIYYPNISAMVKALEFVNQLQHKYCEFYEENK